ncbi:MAG: hypothetical protein AAF611_20470 [Bacteroidota bacterium]
MKKQTVKNLSLNKKSVYNLQIEHVSGGIGTGTVTEETQSFVGPVCNCAALSRFRDIRSLCLCL